MRNASLNKLKGAGGLSALVKASSPPWVCGVCLALQGVGR